MAAPTAHVMVVDDDERLRRLARLTIEDETHATVTEASSGPDALDGCVRKDVDVIVLDLHMPDQDGLQLLRTLNNLSDRPCIIAWSGDEVALRRALDAGAEAKVYKPDLCALVNAIRFCLHIRGKDADTRPPA